MALYTVHTPPVADAGAADPMAYVFVKEGFCWPALLIPELWLLFRRMWLAFAGFVALTIVIIALGTAVESPLTGLVLIVMRLLLALEGNELRRWSLSRRNYRQVDVVQGERLSEAELRFFIARQQAAAAPAPPSAPRPPIAPPAERVGENDDVVGLFPAPGGGS